MSTQGAASSNVDMLRLEYPRSITEIVEFTVVNDETVEVHDPPVWMTQMIHQYTSARRDLVRLYEACGNTFDRNDRRIRDIEQNYQVLADGIRYVYDQAKSDSVVTRDWIQTELTATAQATQEMSQQLWQVILAKNEEDEKRDLLQGQERSRLQDALAFHQAAAIQRDHEMAAYRRNLEAWAEKQQATTQQLMAGQQALQSEVAAAQAAVRQVATQATAPQAAIPSFLQAVPSRPPRTSRPTVAADIEGTGTTRGAPPAQIPAATATVTEAPAAQPPRPEATGGAAGAPPNQPPRPPVAGAAGAPPPGGSPGGSTPSTPTSRGGHDGDDNRENRNAREAREFAQILAEAMATAQQDRPQPAQRTTVAKLKIKEPEKFDGKPKTPFRSWWESVQEFTAFHPDTAERQWITWVGTLLSDEAKEWHQHRRRTLRGNDTWAGYQAAIQEEYHDPREAADAFVKLEKLRYQGDIKAYLTAFRALNIHAGSTGQGLQRLIDLAMPDDILEMRASQFRGVLNDDEGFLAATYEAGRQRERLKALKAERNEARGGQPRSGGSGSGSGTGKDQREPRGQGRQRTEGSDKRGQTARQQRQEPTGGQRWQGTAHALVGVPQSEVAQHKEARAKCWRCGYNSHNTRSCYARKTIGGSDLPEAPAPAAAAASSKRKCEEQELVHEDAPTPKHSRTSAAKVEEDVKEDIPVWAEDSSEEEGFQECEDF